MKPNPHYQKPGGPKRADPRGGAALSHRQQQPAPSAVTHWDNVSEWYDQLVGDEGSEYHREVVLPGVLRMLGAAEESRSAARDAKKERTAVSLRILDLACGQGVLCRELAKRGHKVVGLDAAVGLIEAARKREGEEKLGIEYEVADATKLLDGSQESGVGSRESGFDAVTVVLAIQNITPLSPVWQGVRGLLKVGGSLIVVMMHPGFRVPRGSDWVWDEPTRTQGRVIKQYLTSGKVEIEMQPGAAAAGKGGEKTVTFHRPLQAYVNTLGNAGLLIDHVEEWASHKRSQAGPKQGELDRSRKEIPMFLALRARKTGA